MKNYFDKNGNPQPLPVGRAEAKENRCDKYIDPEKPCPVCSGVVFHTSNRKCLKCAIMEASDLYGYVVGSMQFVDFPDATSTAHETGFGNRDVGYAYKRWLTETAAALPRPIQTTAAGARESCVDTWIRPNPCGKAGHPGVRTINGKCWYCENRKTRISARQAAIQAGETWYTPETPCPKCGTRALRSVNNGRCRGC